jgi:hypothetical protein
MLREFSRRLKDTAGLQQPALGEAQRIIASMTRQAETARDAATARKLCNAWDKQMAGWRNTIRALKEKRGLAINPPRCGKTGEEPTRKDGWREIYDARADHEA